MGEGQGETGMTEKKLAMLAERVRLLIKVIETDHPDWFDFIDATWRDLKDAEAHVGGADASGEKLPNEAFAIRALDAAALWEPEKMRELADTIEREPHYAICEAQYLRTIAHRLAGADAAPATPRRERAVCNICRAPVRWVDTGFVCPVGHRNGTALLVATPPASSGVSSNETERQLIGELAVALASFYTMVKGESPSLLEDDIDAIRAQEAIEKVQKYFQDHPMCKLASGVSEAPRREWQPIETVPKDGTRVLLWNGYRRVIGWYSRYDDMSSGWHHQNILGEPLGRRDIDPETHWMPLPSPPAVQERE